MNTMGWGGVILHDRAIDLYEKGYTSDDVWTICCRYGYSYEVARKMCDIIRECEYVRGRRN